MWFSDFGSGFLVDEGFRGMRHFIGKDQTASTFRLGFKHSSGLLDRRALEVQKGLDSVFPRVVQVTA